MQNRLSHIFLLLAIFICSAARAATPDSVSVSGVAQDAVTKIFLTDYVVRSYALDADGAETWVRTDTCRDIATRYTDNDWVRDYVLREMTSRQRCTFDFNLLPGRYRIVVDHDRYEPAEQIIEIPAKQRGRATTEWTLKDFQLTRKARELGEAVVNSTRIKMMLKGDTVVYNAEAFQLAEGSMLDALVEMMPGLEIRAGGKIYHNGEYIPELLLNGKDFFKGDPSVALKNLPAYTVKELRVYHKAPDGAYLRDNSRADTLSWDKALDVRLKKEYTRSWLGNVEAAGGAGPEQGQYLSRFFLLGFTQRSRFSVYGNANNLSNQERASEDGEWGEDWSRWDSNDGTKRVEYGGLDFNTESRNSKVKFNTSLTARNEHDNVERYTSSTSFLPTGDVFNRSHSDSHTRRTELQLQESIKFMGKDVYAELIPAVSYINSRSDVLSLSAQFDADPQDAYRGEALDSVFAGRLPYVNRLSNTSLGKTQEWQGSATYNLYARTPWLRNNVSLYGNTTYNNSTSKNWSHYDLVSQQGRDFRNQHSNSPSTNFSTYVAANYSGQDLKYFGYSVSYNYNKIITTGDYNLYRFDKLGGEWSNPALPLTGGDGGGLLPSMTDWQTLCIDAENSYNSRNNADSHLLQPQLKFMKKDVVQLELIPALQHTRLHHRDTRSQLAEGEVLRHYNFFQPEARLRYMWKPRLGLDSLQREQSNGSVVFSYNRSNSAPSSTHLLLIRNTSDPLYLMLGNPDLHSSSTDNLSLNSRIMTPTRYLQFSANYSRTCDAIAQGMSYNAATGAYTYRPENIDGNWTASASTLMQFSPKDSPFVVFNYLDYSFNHSVDLISGQRSVVLNHGVTEAPSLTFTKGKYTAKADANIRWLYATSDRANYTTRSTFDLNYGFEFNARDVLWGLSFSTDLNLYQRRGYDDASMNDNSLIWNAQLSRSFGFRHKRSSPSSEGRGGGPWTLMLKGHDLLHQLSQVRRTLNAQGLTETWVNGVPSYVMLHLIYRFNWQPKKRTL
ncbi:MAG: outer membrane beta-barrel protein [Bacteroidales bacterium]|nr:outer membrane beta-barrel protein [Bacteroidales bacterium]